MVEVFGKPVPSSDFVRHNDRHEQVITTMRLPDYIDEWQKRVESLSWEDRQTEFKKINQFTRELFLFYMYCEDMVDLEDLCPRASRMPLLW